MLSDITLGQYFPGTSVLHRLDPRSKILATLCFIVIIFIAKSSASYILLCAFAVCCALLSRVPLKLIYKGVKPVFIIACLTALIHIFSTKGGEVLFSYGIVTVTALGVEMGAKMALRLLLLLLFSSLLTYTTSPIVLTDGIEALLRPFKSVGVPAHELAMMMTIALRFIPTLLEETDRIMKAQTARGADFAGGSILTRLKSLLPILVPLFVSSFRRADELATAMEARCYRGGEGRTRLHELAYGTLDGGCLAVMLLLTAAMAALRWLS